MNKRNFNVIGKKEADNQELAKGIAFKRFAHPEAIL